MITSTPNHSDFKRAAERLIELANGMASDAVQTTGGGQQLTYSKSIIDKLASNIVDEVHTMRCYVNSNSSNNSPMNETRLDEVRQFIATVRIKSPRELASNQDNGWSENRRANHHRMHDFIDNVDMLLLGGVSADAGVGDKELGTQLEYLQAVADDLSSTEGVLTWNKEYAASIGIGLLNVHNCITSAIKRYEQMLGTTPGEDAVSSDDGSIVGITGALTRYDFEDAQEIIRNWYKPPESNNECHDALYHLVHIARKLIPLPELITPNPDDPPADLTEQMVHQVEHGDVNCGCCRYWLYSDRSMGECRFNPPTLSACDGYSNDCLVAFPETSKSEWCGQFQPNQPRSKS